MGMTLSAVLTGLVLGTLSGTAVGMALALHRAVRDVVKPYLVFLASIQVFTIAPLLIIWFGIGWEAKVAMAMLATCFVALHQVASGIEVTEQRYLNYAKSLHAGAARAMWRITLPGALQWVLAGFKLNISFAVLGTLIGEFISAEEGLGHYIFKASGIYDVPRVWLGVFLLCFMVVGMTALANRFACVWADHK
jgi:NitT/TauT family transport system permease protein